MRTSHGEVGRSPGPEEGQIELDGVEWLGANHRIIAPGGDDPPPWAVESEDFQRACYRVDEPRMTYLGSGIKRQLVGTIDRLGRRRDHFAHPIGCEVEESRVRDFGHPFAPPSREIRDEDVSVEMKLGLIQDDPPTGPSLPEAKGARERPAEVTRRVCMRRGGPRMSDQGTVDDLADHVTRETLQVRICRATHGRGNHR
jgi:hypothetical protein